MSKKLKRISDKRKQQLKDEDVLRAELLVRSGGKGEQCGENSDWRGLSLSHTKPKGMGGTTHKYTADEVQLLCGVCHDLKHGIVDK